MSKDYNWGFFSHDLLEQVHRNSYKDFVAKKFTVQFVGILLAIRETRRSGSSSLLI